MARKPKLDEAAVQKIVEMYDGGQKTINQIAKEFKIAVDTVKKYLKKQGKYKIRKYRKAAAKGKIKAAAKDKKLTSEDILRQLRSVESEVVRLKKSLANAIAAEEKRFINLKKLIKL